MVEINGDGILEIRLRNTEKEMEAIEKKIDNKRISEGKKEKLLFRWYYLKEYVRPRQTKTQF